MINPFEIIETINMIDKENLDIRTITMGISLRSCVNPDVDKACENIYKKITTYAKDLVKVGEDIENQYGETYKVARRLNNNYVMDVNKTGNVFIAYTLEGGSVKSGSYGVTQNLDAKVDLSLGFKPTYNNFKIDAVGLAQIRELSATLWAEYKACDSEDALEAFIASAKARIAESAAVGAHLDYDHGANEDGSEKACSGSCGSLQCSYAAWLKKMKITK